MEMYKLTGIFLAFTTRFDKSIYQCASEVSGAKSVALIRTTFTTFALFGGQI